MTIVCIATGRRNVIIMDSNYYSHGGGCAGQAVEDEDYYYDYYYYNHYYYYYYYYYCCKTITNATRRRRRRVIKPQKVRIACVRARAVCTTSCDRVCACACVMLCVCVRSAKYCVYAKDNNTDVVRTCFVGFSFVCLQTACCLCFRRVVLPRQL